MNINDLSEMFYTEYGRKKNEDKIKCFFSPGRVNLIGEHIDYNGGSVFPAALTIGIYAAMRYREDNLIRLISKNAAGEVTVNLEDKDNMEYNEADGWGNYPKGVIKYLMDFGISIRGCDILYYSDLPDAAGLSSSAALEVLTAYMLSYSETDSKINRIEIAKLCKKVENEYIGVNCGIMDQFSVAMGLKNKAMLLDCNTLEYQYIPFVLNDYSLIVMNTNKRRELADSKYNERRGECEKVLSIVNSKVENKFTYLCDIPFEIVEKYINDKVLLRRAKHVIMENNRVKQAVTALSSNSIEEFGQLMIKSHESLRYDYEVTGLHLDTMVEEALKSDGCIGARMTGAGFGGCAIAIVKNSSVESFKRTVEKSYKEKTGIRPLFYRSVIGDGVRLLGK